MAAKQPETSTLEALVEHFRALEFDDQFACLKEFQSIVDEGVQEKRKALLAQLHELDAMSGRPDAALQSEQVKEGRTSKPVEPKYRSKKEPLNQWSGRGANPKWLVEEMAETGKPKEFFLIDKAA